MISRPIAVVIPLTSLLFGCALSRTRGNDATIAPTMPWNEFSRHDFSVDLDRPAHIAVLSIVRSSGGTQVALIYADSTGTPAAKHYDVAVAGPAPNIQPRLHDPHFRLVWHCDSVRELGFLGCYREFENRKPASMPHVEKLGTEYYVVLAFDKPQSAGRLRESLGRVDSDAPVGKLVDQLARDLLASDSTVHWAARLQFLP